MNLAVGMAGKPPSVIIQPALPNPEKHKYEKLWNMPEYRKVSPGEHRSQMFLRQARPPKDESVIDFGAGTGRGALMMALLGGLKVTMLDFVPGCLDEEVRNTLYSQPDRMKFIEHDLEKPSPVSARYGFCCDVMEHIPEDKVPIVLKNIIKASQHVFFGISTEDDRFGEVIGEKLHMTVKPFAWWLTQLRKLDVVLHWSQDNGGREAMFYVSGWNDAREVIKGGAINTPREELEANIRSSVQRGLAEAMPYDRQETPLLILGGGWSLNDHWDEIREKREAGAKLITLNGTYRAAIDHGLTPSAQVMCDARGFNTRFLEPIMPGVKYMISSQCPSATFDAVPADQTLLWHAVVSHEFGDLLDEEYAILKKTWFPTPGGSTVMLRAFCLLRMLGYYRFEVYGFDSCLSPSGEHHAYSQPENDGKPIVNVTCGDRVFKCHPWMLSQAQEYMDEVGLLGDEVKMVVHGDGLIAHILNTGAQMKE